MLYTRTVLAVVMALLLITPLTAHSDEVDDLQAAYEQLIAAINKQDLDGLMALFHDQWMGFGANAPFPTEGKAAARQGWQTLFNDTERTPVTPMNMQYRVIGHTGHVIGHVMAAFKPQDGPVQTTFLRLLGTWTKVDGKWLVVATHLSYIPPGN